MYNVVGIKFDSSNRMFELAIGRSLIENRFLGFKGKEVVKTAEETTK